MCIAIAYDETLNINAVASSMGLSNVAIAVDTYVIHIYIFMYSYIHMYS